MESIKKIIQIALYTPGLNDRWGLPLLFWGQPGVGKSKVIEQTSGECGLLNHTLIASIREPSDFGGLPIPVKRGEKTFIEYTPAGWAADLALDGDDRGVVFVDEITTCAPAVQAALLRLVLNGALGDYTLPKGIRFIAAANDTADAAGGWDLAPPLANRFGHIKWDQANGPQWAEWLIGVRGDELDVTAFKNGKKSKNEASRLSPKEEESRVLKVWPEAFAKAKGAVAAFIKARPDLLHQMPKAGQTSRSKAWPSPRTWELATRALAGCQVHGADELTEDALIAAFVGQAQAAEFQTFKTKLDLPDPADVLDGKVKFKHEPTRLDRTVAVMASCAALIKVKEVKNRKDRGDKLWEIVNKMIDDAADLAIPPAAALIAEGLGIGTKDATSALIKLNPVLTESGYRVR